jgi:hypothetical protein
VSAIYHAPSPEEAARRAALHRLGYMVRRRGFGRFPWTIHRPDGEQLWRMTFATKDSAYAFAVEQFCGETEAA